MPKKQIELMYVELQGDKTNPPSQEIRIFFMVDVNSNSPKYSRNKGKKSDDINISFKIFQNIRGMKGKINELMLSLVTDEPSIICLSEHHLNVYEMDVAYIPNYKFGAGYCRKKHKNGGTCIFIHEDYNFSALYLRKFSKGKGY
jgi:hypothetical protein